MSKNASYRHLETWIGRNLDIAAEIPAQGRLRSSFDRLQSWQQARLDATYSDLASQQRFTKACRFFLGELYGGGDWQARDKQLARVLPLMRRILSKSLLYALGEAMRLQVMSLELDLDMARILIDTGSMDQPAYAAAYRKQARWKDRKEQISLVRSLGEQLDDIVSKPGLHRLVRVMRRPARLGGVGLLQDFLERGLDAFANLGEAEDFLGVICGRELQALEAMRKNDDWPYRPWIGTGPDMSAGQATIGQEQGR